MKKHLALAVGAVMLVAAAAYAAADKFSFWHDPEVGDKSTYTMEMILDVQGMSITAKGEQTSEVTVANKGVGYAIETVMGEITANVMGETQTFPATPAVTTKLTREGVEVTGGAPDSPSGTLTSLMLFFPPEEEKGVGDSWEVTFDGATLTTGVTVKTTYTVKSVGKKGDQDAVEVGFLSVEQAGSAPASAEGTMWLDTTTFELIELQSEIKNMPLMGQFLADAEVTLVLKD